MEYRRLGKSGMYVSAIAYGGTMALAWVLQNPNVAAAIVGASRPEQVRQNARAAGVRLDADLMKGIDDVLDSVVERDPTKIDIFHERP